MQRILTPGKGLTFLHRSSSICNQNIQKCLFNLFAKYIETGYGKAMHEKQYGGSWAVGKSHEYF
jgi:hypothetical protein